MDSASLHVTVFQSARAGASADELIASLGQGLEQPDVRGTQLLLCPELFLGGYRAGSLIPGLAEERDGPFAQRVARLARERNVAIAYGYPERAESSVFNSAAVFGADGALLAHHRKQRLPNEYEKAWFRTGEGYTLFGLKGFRIGLLICYEAEFPEPMRRLAAQGADLVLVSTALSKNWPLVARAVIPTRAFENGIYVAYANHGGEHEGYAYLGESCIAGPDGQDLARAGSAEQVIGAGISRGAIAEARAKIPYLADSRGL